MKKHENMAQPPIFREILTPGEKLRKELNLMVKDKLSKSLFNNPKNWPIYPKYLPRNDPRFKE